MKRCEPFGRSDYLDFLSILIALIIDIFFFLTKQSRSRVSVSALEFIKCGMHVLMQLTHCCWKIAQFQIL